MTNGLQDCELRTFGQGVPFVSPPRAIRIRQAVRLAVTKQLLKGREAIRGQRTLFRFTHLRISGVLGRWFLESRLLGVWVTMNVRIGPRRPQFELGHFRGVLLWHVENKLTRWFVGRIPCLIKLGFRLLGG